MRKKFIFRSILTVGFSALTACQGIGGNEGTPSGRRKGEPTVDQKYASASTRSERTPDHPAIGTTHPAANGVQPYLVVGGVKVLKTSPFPAVIYETGLNVDADGSPRAYHPNSGSAKGLDYLADAGHPGNWWGIVAHNGKPVVQGPNDPAPGYYVSTTSLMDPSFGKDDPRAYVNASEIPFIVLPLGHGNFGGHLGDIGAVVNFKNGKVAYVIAADEGPRNKLGEGSVALAKALGVNSSARDGGTSSKIGYCFFPGSGNARPQSKKKIDQLGAELFSKFGGAAKLKKLLNTSD